MQLSEAGAKNRVKTGLLKLSGWLAEKGPAGYDRGRNRWGGLP
jgi:hypothetical protein